MERINLSVLSGVSHEGMLQLKSYVDMTGSDPQHQSYDYECLFPENCNPREICLSFVKTADGYTFRVNPHFRYDGRQCLEMYLRPPPKLVSPSRRKRSNIAFKLQFVSVFPAQAQGIAPIAF